MGSDRYLTIKAKLVDIGYANEIDWAESLKPCTSASNFMIETIWVILNSGMKNQVARKIMDRVFNAIDLGNKVSSVFGHKGKASAIEYILSNYDRLFKEYQEAKDKLAYLETLPWIGKITKYHLARNLGFDVCKPDRHLERLAKQNNTTPHELCKELANITGDRIGVVDVVLWRAANLGLV